MGKHVVHVPEGMLANGRRRLTAAEWLAECAVIGPARRCRLPEPITIKATAGRGDQAGVTVSKYRDAGDLFRALDSLAAAGAVVVGVSWRGARLGPQGLFALNRAIQTPAVRRGGLNIVQHWRRNNPFGQALTGETFRDLLAFLEIRPLPSRSAAAAAADRCALCPKSRKT